MSSGVYDSSRLITVLPTEAYHTIPEVLDTMDVLESELVVAGLAHVVAFNGVYREVTSTVDDHLVRGDMFDSPAVVQRTVGIFAKYYFDQLLEFANDNEAEVTGPWHQLLYSDHAKNAPQGIQFLLGMNAHINLDLAQALNTSDVPLSYYSDYREVMGTLLDITAHRLSKDYIPISGVSRDMLTTATVDTIARWREKAWRNGMKLQAVREDELATQAIIQKMERSATRKGGILLTAGSLALNTMASVSRAAA